MGGEIRKKLGVGMGGKMQACVDCSAMNSKRWYRKTSIYPLFLHDTMNHRLRMNPYRVGVQLGRAPI